MPDEQVTAALPRGAATKPAPHRPGGSAIAAQQANPQAAYHAAPPPDAATMHAARPGAAWARPGWTASPAPLAGGVPPQPPVPGRAGMGGFAPFAGPGMPAPSWLPRGTARRRSRKPWFWAAAGVVAVIAVVVTVATTAGGGESHSHPTARSAEPTPAPAVPKPKTPAPVPVSALAGLLPSRDELASAAGTGPKAQFRTAEVLYHNTIVDQDCVGAVSIGDDAFFRGSGWTAARSEDLVPPAGNEDRERAAWVAVVSYPTAAAAAAMYAKTVALYGKCAGKSVNLRDPSNPSDRDAFSIVGQPTEAGGIVSVTDNVEGGEGWSCQRGLSAHNNVVITAQVCGDNLPGGVLPALINPTAAKVDAQP
ncbi:sensor domain-containing protein [uncultured Mycobacterium sp.]|uniref:sensor domain-containing protein n=1 Tax=uncultured Mycobacterium sp. TaxID=171292 RepID=UPI0035C99D41